MDLKPQFCVEEYEFSSQIIEELNGNPFVKDLWPLVYILSDDDLKKAYIGETTDAPSRMYAHLSNNRKNQLTTAHIITSEKFNKSATLDIESNLIKYLFGDGHYTLLNGNLGLANHNYYQKRDIYWRIFSSIWNKLQAKGITKHSLEHIDNSDLFKYSPYKSLTKEQTKGLIAILKGLLNEGHKNIIIEGGAGTGKTIVATFLFKILHSEQDELTFRQLGKDDPQLLQLIELVKAKFHTPKIALVVPMSSFRSTLKKVFKNIRGLKSKMVIGPAEAAKEKYDILVVDESHRLRRRNNLGTYFGNFDKVSAKLNLEPKNNSELDWVLKQSQKTILFYDKAQSIKPSDVRKEDFAKLKGSKQTIITKLESQFRVKGGNAYIDFVEKLLSCGIEASNHQYRSDSYEFLLFDSIEDMIKEVKLKEEQEGLSRLIAGYSWKWRSKTDKGAYDIEIENCRLRWNSTSNDWINSDNAVNEVGCIHTTQGYDLNYAGIIIGNEVTYDKKNHKLVILSENYYDINGKSSIEDPNELTEYIINIYKTILLRGIKGTYVYVCDEELRKYLSKHIPGVPSVVESEHEVQAYRKEKEEIIPFENSVPLFDLRAAAGGFGQAHQIGEEQEWIIVPHKYRPANDLFACKVIGESMNKIIPNGSTCLFRKYREGSRNGKIVLVEHYDIQDPDSGTCYTVKEYQSKKQLHQDGWEHQSILLKPRSDDPSYSELALEGEEGAMFQVIGIFECVL